MPRLSSLEPFSPARPICRSRLESSIASSPTGLNVIRIDARGALGGKLAQASLLPAIEIDILKVEGVDVTWDVAETCEADVDQEVGAAAGDHVNADGRQEDGYEDDEEGGSCV